MENIKVLHYNYNQNDDSVVIAKVGEDNVKFIREHCAAGEGDKWYYDIEYINGKTERIFNPNKVISIGNNN